MKIWLYVLIGAVIMGWFLFGLYPDRGFAASVSAEGQMELAQKATEPAPTQPPPPPVEVGANAPLVCGAIVLLMVIVGGVMWHARLRKPKPGDH